MGVVDRTDEFRQLLQQMSAQVGKGSDVKAAPQQPQVQGALNALSAEIGAEIHKSSLKLKELRKVAKAKGIFNNKTNEVQELAFAIKEDIARLDEAVEALEQKTKGAGPNRSYQAHSKSMVETLKTRLLKLTKDFKDVLEVRTKTLQQQEGRKQIYSFGGGQANSFGVRSGGMKCTGNADDPEAGGGSQAQQFLYHNSRADAVQSVQKTIGELAQMFQKMAVLVTSQDEMIQRIDHDVDESFTSVEHGQEHLLMYFHSISSNRWLIMKVFCILVTFVAFFVVFLA